MREYRRAGKELKELFWCRQTLHTTNSLYAISARALQYFSTVQLNLFSTKHTSKCSGVMGLPKSHRVQSAASEQQLPISLEMTERMLYISRFRPTCEDPLGPHFENENNLESDKSQ
ncbi:hypothetical protein TNCV_4951721 [Trichonephila clavipes]|nr:hypothetical protein TNCV_4951721 [Trichonephila clavipes]